MTVISPTVAIKSKTFEIQDVSLISRAVLTLIIMMVLLLISMALRLVRSFFWRSYSYSMTSDGYHEAQLGGNVPERYFFDKTLLNNGSNAIAIRHNQALSSSDMSALPVISLELPEGPGTY